MNPEVTLQFPPSGESAVPVLNAPLAERVVEVYEAAPPDIRSQMLTQLVVMAFTSAPPPVRRQLLEQLIRPLGLLSLSAVAGGIFAKIRLRSGWQDLQVRIEDVQNLDASDLAALVDHVQQVSIETMTSVARLIAASPWTVGSAVAAVLISALVRHARIGRFDSGDGEDFPALPA